MSTLKIFVFDQEYFKISDDDKQQLINFYLMKAPNVFVFWRIWWLTSIHIRLCCYCACTSLHLPSKIFSKYVLGPRLLIGISKTLLERLPPALAIEGSNELGLLTRKVVVR